MNGDLKLLKKKIEKRNYDLFKNKIYVNVHIE